MSEEWTFDSLSEWLNGYVNTYQEIVENKPEEFIDAAIKYGDRKRRQDAPRPGRSTSDAILDLQSGSIQDRLPPDHSSDYDAIIDLPYIFDFFKETMESLVNNGEERGNSTQWKAWMQTVQNFYKWKDGTVAKGAEKAEKAVPKLPPDGPQDLTAALVYHSSYPHCFTLFKGIFDVNDNDNDKTLWRDPEVVDGLIESLRKNAKCGQGGGQGLTRSRRKVTVDGSIRGRRKSTKRKSTRRKSTRRKSTRRNPVRRKSTKRKSTRRKSKRKSVRKSRKSKISKESKRKSKKKILKGGSIKSFESFELSSDEEAELEAMGLEAELEAMGLEEAELEAMGLEKAELDDMIIDIIKTYDYLVPMLSRILGPSEVDDFIKEDKKRINKLGKNRKKMEKELKEIETEKLLNELNADDNDDDTKDILKQLRNMPGGGKFDDNTVLYLKKWLTYMIRIKKKIADNPKANSEYINKLEKAYKHCKMKIIKKLAEDGAEPKVAIRELKKIIKNN